MANHYEHKESPYSSHSLLLKYLPKASRGSKLLDVGCWDGKATEQYLKAGFTVTGIERSKHLSLPDGIELIVADLNKGLPVIEGEFQCIVCADVLEHILEPAAILRALRAHISEDGKMLASLPNSGHWYFRLIVLLGYFPKRPNGLFDATHIHFFPWDGWVKLFEQSGFTIEFHDATSLPLSLAFQNWNQAITIGIGERISYVLAKLWKRLFAYQFVIICRPSSG